MITRNKGKNDCKCLSCNSVYNPNEHLKGTCEYLLCDSCNYHENKMILSLNRPSRNAKADDKVTK